MAGNNNNTRNRDNTIPPANPIKAYYKEVVAEALSQDEETGERVKGYKRRQSQNETPSQTDSKRHSSKAVSN